MGKLKVIRKVGKRQDGRHRKMDAGAPSCIVFLIRGGLTCLPKDPLFTVIASSLTIHELQIHMLDSHRKTSTLLE